MIQVLPRFKSISGHLHDWVDRRNKEYIEARDKFEVESSAWNQQLDAIAAQQQYESTYKLAKRVAEEYGLVQYHASGMKVLCGELKNATGQQLIEWLNSEEIGGKELNKQWIENLDRSRQPVDSGVNGWLDEMLGDA